MRRACASFFLALIVCAVNISSAAAQQSVTSATLGGRVEDERGDTVSGVHVVATNLDTGQQRSTTSDDDGRYRFLSLPVGLYQLTAEREGFAPVRRNLVLTIGQALDATLQLPVASVAENVNIMESDVPLVEIARTQVAETILPRDTDTLPLNGRNYLDLALLVPGVSRTNTGSNQRFAETSAVPGTGLSVAGQRNLNNSFVLDGLSANDDAADLAGTFYSQEVVREFQVITSGGITEFGRSSGGIVNIITQSGTNRLAGRLYGFARNQRFDARNPLASVRDPLTQAQYGATLGGPVRRNRTFFFTNFEQTRRTDAGVITITQANASAINARLDATRYAGARIQTGIFPSGFDSTNFFGRLDHELTTAQRLTARYSFYDIESTNARSVGGLNAVSRGSNLDNRDQTFALSHVAALSSAALNEARFQFTRSRLSAPVNEQANPAVNIAGVANFGTATFSPLARALDVFEATDAFTSQRGAHTLKAGGQFLLNRVDVLFPGALSGVYTFSSLANFQAGRYITFQQAFGAPSQFQSNPNLGLFVQDEWRAHSRLTVNAGLRYDAQFLPSPIETDTNNIAPRLGLAYAPGDDRRTVLRASVGLYFDRLPLRATSNALQRDGVRYKVAVLAFGQPGAPAFPETLDAFPSGLLTAVTTIDPEIENSYSTQASLQLERELPLADASLAVGYLHLRGRHLVLSRNTNVPALTAAEAAARGDINLGRPDPRFANVSRFESSGESQYDALTVSLNRRARRDGIALRLSYTLSKAIDTAGNFFFSTPQDNFNLRAERGLSDNDQRHRLTLSGSLETPSKAGASSALWRAVQNFQLSYIFTYASATPFNVQTGTDRNNDTNANDRPPGVGRNTGRGFDFASLDLRLSRKFKLTERMRLEALAEGFNVFNRANLQLPNNIFGTGLAPRAGFGQPTAAADPRQLQFGLRLDF